MQTASAPPRIGYGLVTSRGKRSRNQDYAACCRDPFFARGFVAALADGLGGHKGGREAAETMVRAFIDGYFGASPNMSPLAAASRAIEAANDWIASIGRRDPQLAHMATTFTALLLTETDAHVLHVGDSRAYRFSAGLLEQLTQDHVVECGEPAQRLRRAIGFDARVSVDHIALELNPGDRVLLCSDGLHAALPAKTIKTILAGAASPLQAAQKLRDAALGAGSADNVTAVVVDFRAPPPSSV